MKTIIVIPARYNSKRFEGKVLFPINSKPILQIVWERAIKSKIAERVVIATEDERVVKFAKSINAEVVLTDKKCPSGSDRVWEVVKDLRYDVIINLQADEPFIEKDVIRKSFYRLIKDERFDIATAVSPINDEKELSNPNCVKVSLSDDGNAIYFSRLPVPFHHPLSDLSKKIGYYKHCGFYVYRYDALKKFVTHKPSTPELLERLEQLRALSIGLKIVAVKVKEIGPAIDTYDDVKKAIAYIKEKNIKL